MKGEIFLSNLPLEARPGLFCRDISELKMSNIYKNMRDQVMNLDFMSDKATIREKTMGPNETDMDNLSDIRSSYRNKGGNDRKSQLREGFTLGEESLHDEHEIIHETIYEKRTETHHNKIHEWTEKRTIIEEVGDGDGKPHQFKTKEFYRTTTAAPPVRKSNKTIPMRRENSVHNMSIPVYSDQSPDFCESPTLNQSPVDERAPRQIFNLVNNGIQLSKFRKQSLDKSQENAVDDEEHVSDRRRLVSSGFTTYPQTYHANPKSEDPMEIKQKIIQLNRVPSEIVQTDKEEVSISPISKYKDQKSVKEVSIDKMSPEIQRYKKEKEDELRKSRRDIEIINQISKELKEEQENQNKADQTRDMNHLKDNIITILNGGNATGDNSVRLSHRTVSQKAPTVKSIQRGFTRKDSTNPLNTTLNLNQSLGFGQHKTSTGQINPVDPLLSNSSIMPSPIPPRRLTNTLTPTLNLPKHHRESNLNSSLQSTYYQHSPDVRLASSHQRYISDPIGESHSEGMEFVAKDPVRGDQVLREHADNCSCQVGAVLWDKWMGVLQVVSRHFPDYGFDQYASVDIDQLVQTLDREVSKLKRRNENFEERNKILETEKVTITEKVSYLENMISTKLNDIESKARLQGQVSSAQRNSVNQSQMGRSSIHRHSRVGTGHTLLRNMSSQNFPNPIPGTDYYNLGTSRIQKDKGERVVLSRAISTSFREKNLDNQVFRNKNAVALEELTPRRVQPFVATRPTFGKIAPYHSRNVPQGDSYQETSQLGAKEDDARQEDMQTHFVYEAEDGQTPQLYHNKSHKGDQGGVCNCSEIGHDHKKQTVNDPDTSDKMSELGDTKDQVIKELLRLNKTLREATERYSKSRSPSKDRNVLSHQPRLRHNKSESRVVTDRSVSRGRRTTTGRQNSRENSSIQPGIHTFTEGLRYLLGKHQPSKPKGDAESKKNRH